MASFQIHEDTENQHSQHAGGFFEKSSKNRGDQRGLRIALQCVTNGVCGVKRVKAACSEGSEEHSVQQHTEVGPSLNLECLHLVSKENAKVCEQEDYYELDDIIFAKEYGSYIWKHLYKMEVYLRWPKPNYMSKQKQITGEMRCILIDWLASVAYEYKMSEQTLYLAVNYIDRFLSCMSVVREKFQLLGAAAMMVAVKVEEVDMMETHEWAYLTGETFTKQQITRMERLLLDVLKFDLYPPTAVTFIQHMCMEHRLDNKTLYMAMYLSELALLEGGAFLQYLPSKLAAASVALARRMLCKSNPWFKALETYSGYSFQQLSPVIMQQHRTFRESPTKEQQAIQKKYKTNNYYKVALLAPKALYVEDCDE